MKQYLKYLPKILFGFKDVTDKYKEETGKVFLTGWCNRLIQLWEAIR